MLVRILLIAVSASLLLTASGAVAEEWTQRAKLVSSETDFSDGFGISVAISGDTAIVGASWGEPGSAYLFGRDVGGVNNWGELIKLTASDTVERDQFGGDVAIWGDLVIVGAQNNNDRTGAAYLFERNHGGPNNWGEVMKFTASDGAPDHGFGASVAISGEIAIVGAWRDNDNAGAAYIYERHSGGANNWGKVATLIASDAATGDLFHAVALSGDTAIVGAKEKNARAGAAYVFGRNENGENTWEETVKLTASDAADGDRFGRSDAVGLWGDTAIVGSFGNDDVGQRSGSAYLFDRDEGGENTWGEVIKISASDAADRDEFGSDVAISGERAIVGARKNEDDVGAAYVFGRDQGGLNNWGEVIRLTASDTYFFGIAVDISGDVAIVGAASVNNDVGELFGAAYIFSTDGPPGSLGDLTGNGFVDFEDLTVLLANWNQDVAASQGNLVDPSTTPVNFEDLTVLAEWTGPGPAGWPEAALRAEAVPEPSSLGLAALGLAIIFLRRRRR